MQRLNLRGVRRIATVAISQLSTKVVSRLLFPVALARYIATGSQFSRASVLTGRSRPESVHSAHGPNPIFDVGATRFSAAKEIQAPNEKLTSLLRAPTTSSTVTNDTELLYDDPCSGNVSKAQLTRMLRIPSRSTLNYSGDFLGTTEITLRNDLAVSIYVCCLREATISLIASFIANKMPQLSTSTYCQTSRIVDKRKRADLSLLKIFRLPEFGYPGNSH